MLLTTNFVFLHVPKTGGSFIVDVCLKSAPPEWNATYSQGHGNYAAIPAEASHLPVLCYVRNPWDWYVSWYEYNMRLNLASPTPEAPRMWASAFDSGNADFNTALTRACTGVGFENRVVAPLMRARGLDYYSAMVHYIAGDGIDAGRVEVERFENLRGGFLAFLARHEIAVPERFREVVESALPVNQSTRRGTYREYYDDGLRELVARKADRLITEYGYTF